MYSLNFISNGEDSLLESRDGKDSNEYVSKTQRLRWNIIKHKDQMKTLLKYKDQKFIFALFFYFF